MKPFESLFRCSSQVTASAPGRVNLLGEHTDYNDGFVLPTAIPQRTTVQLALSRDKQNHIYAENLNEHRRYQTGEPVRHGFMAYVSGCVELLQTRFTEISPVYMHISSNVPIGAGLSSSAALEVAVLRAYRELFQLQINDVDIAQIAQEAEIKYAQVRVGIMDQMAAALADTEHMLFIDTRSLATALLPLPIQSQPIVIDSGVPRRLAGSVYNTRRAECEEAARQLGVKSLRDIADPALVSHLPPPLNRRAHHVVSENNRVSEAAAGVPATRFGALMNASHASLKEDYEVSIEALDVLTDIMQNAPGVHGARLTGAGFGGACVALSDVTASEHAAKFILQEYHARGYKGKIIVPPDPLAPNFQG